MISEEELFHAVLSGNYNNLAMCDEEKFLFLLKHKHITVHDYISKRESTSIKIQCVVTSQYVWDGIFTEASIVHFAIAEGWNNETIRTHYETNIHEYDTDECEYETEYEYWINHLAYGYNKYTKWEIL